MSKPKRDLPIWQVGLVVVAALGVVALFYSRGGAGEAGKQELANMRHVQGNQPLVIPHAENSGSNVSR